MRSPELVNRYVELQPAYNGGTSGRLPKAAQVEVPKGAIAVVDLYALIVSSSVLDPVAGWPVLPGLAFEASLSNGTAGSERILQLAKEGRVPVATGTSAPSARTLVPAGTELSWWAVAESPTLIADRAPEAQVLLWARAMLVDADTPPAELARLCAGVR